MIAWLRKNTSLPRRIPSSPQAPVTPLLLKLTATQWAFIVTGWMAYACDGIDFFTVSLSINALTKEFGRSTSDITRAITLTSLFRPFGAIIFGTLSDRFGRKWPLVANLTFIAVLELGSGFAQNYEQFLAMRAVFGIGMGGIWGSAQSTALENIPVETRGIVGGFIQQSYAVGYLVAAVINLTLVPANQFGWRSLFWTGSGLSIATAIIRAALPESHIFVRAQRAEKEKGRSFIARTRTFVLETKVMLRDHWGLFIYMILFLTGYSFLAHGSQDLYPTFLEQTKNMSSHKATVATIVGNCGAVVGGILSGSISQWIGRRIALIGLILVIGAAIPLWILPNGFPALTAGAFVMQFGVQGTFGVIPIHISEISPPAFRAVFPGLAYQLAVMISAASAQIEATGGEHLTTTISSGNKTMIVPNYAKVQAILIGSAAAFALILTVIGPENHASHFEQHKAAFQGEAIQYEGDDVDLEKKEDVEQVELASHPVRK